jgi:hypothetical protein
MPTLFLTRTGYIQVPVSVFVKILLTELLGPEQ